MGGTTPVEAIRIVIAALAVTGSGAYLRWGLAPVWIAYEIGKIIGGRRYARKKTAR
jgi:hypothetical protein